MTGVVNDFKMPKHFIKSATCVVKRFKPHSQEFKRVHTINAIRCSIYFCLTTILVMVDRGT